MHGSRSLEMFQQSLVENSSQEESQVSETRVQAVETPENRVSQGNEKPPEEETHIEKESGMKYITSSENGCNHYAYAFKARNYLMLKEVSFSHQILHVSFVSLKAQGEVNMETDATSTTDLPLLYECKLNDVEEGNNTDDVKIKSRRTR